jgi:hypothetical protein
MEFGFGTAFAIFALVGWALIAVTGLQVLSRAHRLWLGFRSRRWPSVEGIVLRSGIRETRVWRSGSGTRLVYVPDVAYAYAVGGQRMDGDAVAVRRPESALRAVIEQIVDDLPEGGLVRVYHHPHRATRSLLVPGPRAGDAVDLLAAAVGVAIGAALVSWTARMGISPRDMVELLGELMRSLR